MAKMVTFHGKNVPFLDLVRQLGVTREALRNRIRRKWPEARWGEPMHQEPKERTPCATCGAPVQRNPAACRNGHGQYCSIKCRPPHFRHGHGRTGKQSRTFRTWHGMKQRCLNPNHRNFHRYGGRGITVCERWMDFANFLADMGERPEDGTLDRIDCDGNYTPENCRWATMKEQCNNWSGKRNLRVEYQGYSYTLQELADALDLNRYTLRRRIFSDNWPEERWSERPAH